CRRLRGSPPWSSFRVVTTTLKYGLSVRIMMPVSRASEHCLHESVREPAARPEPPALAICSHRSRARLLRARGDGGCGNDDAILRPVDEGKFNAHPIGRLP